MYLHTYFFLKFEDYIATTTHHKNANLGMELIVFLYSLYGIIWNTA